MGLAYRPLLGCNPRHSNRSVSETPYLRAHATRIGSRCQRLGLAGGVGSHAARGKKEGSKRSAPLAGWRSELIRSLPFPLEPDAASDPQPWPVQAACLARSESGGPPGKGRPASSVRLAWVGTLKPDLPKARPPSASRASGKER